MSRSANPADFPTFVPNDDPKRKGAAFPHRLLAQHFRKEEDRLAPSIGVRRRCALESHLRIHAAYYVIIDRHGAIYVGDARGFTSSDTGHRGIMQRPDKQAWDLDTDSAQGDDLIQAPEPRRNRLFWPWVLNLT